jgi:hypothetical protein
MVVGRLPASLRKREELVAHVDEGRPASAASQLELEDPAVEVERLLDVPDLECDVVDPDQSRLHRV